MAILPILTAPDPRLKAVSEPVGRVDGEIRKLIDDMLETMYDADGVGLAAVQVGVPLRMLVMDIAQMKGGREPRVYINPKIVWVSDEKVTAEEGCLSVPEIWEEVERPARIRVEYVDRDGAAQTLEAEGLLACCLQHEMDHLDGVLFIDHISRLKRGILMRRLTKAKAKRLKDAV
ncbi:MAG TPA: peptide deformylase [Rhizomicrobium sp.]|jgi:peptide deformylase|nr:peptide deformylase [Rhizomicrobium sp.]